MAAMAGRARPLSEEPLREVGSSGVGVAPPTARLPAVGDDGAAAPQPSLAGLAAGGVPLPSNSMPELLRVFRAGAEDPQAILAAIRSRPVVRDQGPLTTETSTVSLGGCPLRSGSPQPAPTMGEDQHAVLDEETQAIFGKRSSADRNY